MTVGSLWLRFGSNGVSGVIMNGSILSDEQWKPIDEFIFLGQTINAIKAIREAIGDGIREAVDIAEERRCKLCERKPEAFVLDEGFSRFKTEYFST